MLSKRVLLALACAATLSLLPKTAHADAPTGAYRIKTAMTCTTEGGTVVAFPPGRFLTEETWNRLEIDYKNLEVVRTRLTAENKSLKESRSVWWVTGSAVIAGILAGKYAL